MLIEIVKFLFLSGLIVLMSKYFLVTLLRKLGEVLNLKANTIGNVAGIATSVPELLTISISSLSGFADASIFNVLSSNVINFIQYIASIKMNNNGKEIKNKGILTDLVLVVATIIIPLLLIYLNIEGNLILVPIFILLMLGIYYISGNAHKLYLGKEEKEISDEIEKEKKWERGNKRKATKYTIYLIIVGILLFAVGNALGNCLENLCIRFRIPQILIGIFLGFVTSIPELITFFESQKHHKNKEDTLLGVVEATNNLLTSNIMNLFVIQSIGIVLYGLFG